MRYNMSIRLRSIPEVHEFVAKADRCDFDVDVGYDRVSIDGKSLVGMLGLDLGRILYVSFDGENPAFVSYLNTKKSA